MGLLRCAPSAAGLLLLLTGPAQQILHPNRLADALFSVVVLDECILVRVNLAARTGCIAMDSRCI